jgi:hypothetical protein
MREQLDSLQHELDEIRGTEPTKKRRIRRTIVAILVVLSCLLVVLSTTVVWAHRTVLNTDTFVGTVAPVFQHPEVDAAVATRATDQLFTSLNLEPRLKEALPDKIAFAAGPITSATENFVASELAKVLESEQFQKVWTATLTSTHKVVVAVLRGQKTPAVSTANGYIVLNTVPLINNALGQVSGLASSLSGKHVTLPTITSAEVPQQAIDKLSNALGVQLPSNFGQITLIHSKNLSTVQRLVKAFDRITILLPILTVVLIAIALWLSVARRRTLLQLLVGVLLLMIIVRRVVIHEQGTLAGSAHNPQVANIILGQVLHGFFVLTAWELGIAAVILIIALVTGPYRWAVWLRNQVVAGVLAVVALVTPERRQQTIAWCSAHANGLQLGGAVVAGILLLIVSVSWLSFLIIALLLAAYEIVLQRWKNNAASGPPVAAG